VQIDEQQQAAVSVLSPRGPMVGEDAGSVLSRVRTALAQHTGRVVLDLTQVSYIDSRGLEVIADLSDEMAQQARQLKVAAANETVREALDLTRVSDYCEQFDDVSSAVRSFS
jgi:anti-anti-sigma factor